MMVETQQKLKEQEGWDAQDRIGNLPDVLLAHILSFVPTRDAVKTSVLSTRWKLLWAYVPALYLRDSEFSPKGNALMDCSKRKANFLTFVYRFLMQNNWSSIERFVSYVQNAMVFHKYSRGCVLKSPNLEELQLVIYTSLAPTSYLPSKIKTSYLFLSYKCLDPHLRQKTSLPTGRFSIKGSYLEDPCILDSLFSLPKEWNFRGLEFEGCIEGFNWRKTCNFPQTLFTCEVLVVLELFQCVDLDCPKNAACFPNLKVLHLVDNASKYHDSASKLINSSCPVLEELNIWRGDRENLQRLVITSDTLKRLEVTFWCYDGEGSDLPFKTLIDVRAVC